MMHDDAPLLDPYRQLIAAIVARAVQDASGQCSPDCAQPRDAIQAEARVWLADEQELRNLIELAGLDSTATVRRVRAVLWETWTPQQLTLFAQEVP